MSHHFWVVFCGVEGHSVLLGGPLLFGASNLCHKGVGWLSQVKEHSHWCHTHMHVFRVFRGTADSVVRPAVRSLQCDACTGVNIPLYCSGGGSKISPPCMCVYVIQGRACDTAESDSDRRFSASRRSLRLGVCLPRCFHWSHIESCKFLWDQKFWRQRSQEDNLSYYVWKSAQRSEVTVCPCVVH